MPTRVIKIIGSDPSTEKLELDDHGHTPADPGDTIIWQIKNNSGVDSIISIHEKGGAARIWETLPHRQGNNWTGDISSRAPAFAVYRYSITWAKGSHTYTHDPKISIKPTPLHRSIIQLVIVIVTAVLGFFTMKFFRERKGRR